MNRYPFWKYALIGLALVLGGLYALPNLFGESPAVQVSPAKPTSHLDAALQSRLEAALQAEGLIPVASSLEPNTLKLRFADTEQQLKAKDLVQRLVNANPAEPNFVVALNLVPASPAWLTRFNAAPMYLGLDLRGGVHFMLQVDMPSALTQRAEGLASDLRIQLRDQNIRHGGINRQGDAIELRVRDSAQLAAMNRLLADRFADLIVTPQAAGSETLLTLRLKPEAARRVQEQALKQNITTLHNRINELGVAEPVIQQQGLDRIVVQLPGVQDTAKAKDILGRTATLEVRMVDESSDARAAELGSAPVPFGSEKFRERNGQPLVLKKQIILTGENLTDAQPGFDAQTQEPVVNLTLDGKGARIFRDITRENIGKRMAIVLFEKGRGEVVTAPVIRSEIGGGRVQISGRMTTVEANDVSLLLRAGSLAAPMEIIEERTIGPSLGAENIAKGFNSVTWGFVAVAVFMSSPVWRWVSTCFCWWPFCPCSKPP
jgi:preprotein translocase subunit SecD